MRLGKWHNQDAPVRIGRKSKAAFDQAIADLLKRGYEVVWQHKTQNFAELRRKSESFDQRSGST